MQAWVRDLNNFYRQTPAMHRNELEPQAFAWVDCNDSQASVISLRRRDLETGREVLIIGNFTPVPREGYILGAPRGGFWREALNSDSAIYGGGDVGNAGGAMARQVPHHGLPHSLELTLPPLGLLFLESE